MYLKGKTKENSLLMGTTVYATQLRLLVNSFIMTKKKKGQVLGYLLVIGESPHGLQ